MTGRLVGPTDFGGVPKLYANYIQVGMSPYDFVMYFSRFSLPILPVDLTENRVVELTPEPVASITIPLNLMRGLIRALQAQMENWEQTFREPVPAEPNTTEHQRPATEENGGGGSNDRDIPDRQ